MVDEVGQIGMLIQFLVFGFDKDFFRAQMDKNLAFEYKHYFDSKKRLEKLIIEFVEQVSSQIDLFLNQKVGEHQFS